MDFDNTKVYGDTSITDGLVFFCVLHIFQNFPCTLGEKSKSVSFSRVYVCVKAKLTLVSFFLLFFYAPFPNVNNLYYLGVYCYIWLHRLYITWIGYDTVINYLDMILLYITLI